MNIVAFQFLSSAIVILTLLGIYYFHNRGEKKVKNVLIVALVIELILGNIVYFNFTGSNERVKQEVKASENIFKSKMETKQETKKFSYKNEYDDVSKSIEQEADTIHKNINK